MGLRRGEWLVAVGTAMIVAFAVLVGVLIYLKPPPARFSYVESAQSVQGEAVFRREGCNSCHRVFGNGATYGPALDGVGSRRSQAWLENYLRAPYAGVGDRSYRLLMPSFEKLEPAKMSVLVAYLSGLREGPGLGEGEQ